MEKREDVLIQFESYLRTPLPHNPFLLSGRPLPHVTVMVFWPTSEVEMLSNIARINTYGVSCLSEVLLVDMHTVCGASDCLRDTRIRTLKKSLPSAPANCSLLRTSRGGVESSRAASSAPVTLMTKAQN